MLRLVPGKEKDALNKPIILFSSLPFSPSPFISLRVFSRRGTAISSIHLFSFSCRRRVSVGSRQRKGNTFPKNRAAAVKMPGLTCPMASNTSATAEGLPSREPKSWEKPAMPILSRLRRNRSNFLQRSKLYALTKRGSSCRCANIF